MKIKIKYYRINAVYDQNFLRLLTLSLLLSYLHEISRYNKINYVLYFIQSVN